MLDNITGIFSDRLNATFTGLEVELKVPPGGGFSYERFVKGKIRGVQFWVSRPIGEVPLAMCKFEVIGKDQFEADYRDLLRENEINTKIPWEKFIPPTNDEIKTLL